MWPQLFIAKAKSFFFFYKRRLIECWCSQKYTCSQRQFDTPLTECNEFFWRLKVVPWLLRNVITTRFFFTKGASYTLLVFAEIHVQLTCAQRQFDIPLTECNEFVWRLIAAPWLLRNVITAPCCVLLDLHWVLFPNPPPVANVIYCFKRTRHGNR